MKQLLQQLTSNAASISRQSVTRSYSQSSRSTFVCVQCRYQRSVIHSRDSLRQPASFAITNGTRRHFSNGKRRSIEENKKIVDSVKPVTTSKQDAAAFRATNESVHIESAEKLPSRREQIRWEMSQRMNKFMDDLMPRLALASQRINTFTGTDYSGIEALRKQILEQETLVKSHHVNLQSLKEAFENARSSESKSRKEVVALLERRHSWTDQDLERYMSLIRSEHLNDQAVQSAKDNVTSAERTLEDARAKLEKMERMQYHEEQIWSDTIRRNSTWVTFGLMGFNIFLLLSTMIAIEPWRRRRMVREIKKALDEKASAQALTAAAAVSAVSEIREKEIDQAIPPEDIPSPEFSTPLVEATVVAGHEPSPAASVIMVEEPPAEVLLEESPSATTNAQPSVLENWKLQVSDLFSKRAVTLRKVDISTVALEGAATGAFVMAILMLLLKPR